MKEEISVLADALRFCDLEKAERFYQSATSHPQRCEQELQTSLILPILCLEYLLSCIANTDETHSDGDADHLSRAEALWELYRPYTKYVSSENEEDLFDLYWSRIEAFLRASDFMPDFSTHFLEPIYGSAKARQRLQTWKHDAQLALYVRDLEGYLQS